VGKEPDKKSDIYALGVILYEMCTREISEAPIEVEQALEALSQQGYLNSVKMMLRLCLTGEITATQLLLNHLDT